MKALTILIIFIWTTNCLDYDFFILSQNNTGPRNRARPVLQCWPKDSDQGDLFPKCIVASGVEDEEGSIFPITFFNDIWRLNVDINTLSVQWELLANETELPVYSKGGYHLNWRKNLTAISFTAGLNDLPAPTTPICNGDKLFTYDFVSRRYELTTPIGGSWGEVSAGGCDRFGADVYCFGGFNCTTVTDTNNWTKYNIGTNIFTVLNTPDLDLLFPGHHNEISTDNDRKRILIGPRDQIPPNLPVTRDQWTYYDIENDQFIFFEPQNKPINEQHISIQAPNYWKIKHNDFKVTKTGDKILTVGGGVPLQFTTIKDIKIFNTDSNKFKNQTAECLFEFEYQRLGHIPNLRHDDEEYSECNYFIQFGGQIATPKEPFRMLNEVVLHRLCDHN